MSDGVKIVTEPLGGSALARRAIAGELPQWYARRPVDGAEWAARCSAVRAEGNARWLDALRPAFGESLAGTAAGLRLARSAQSSDGVVVTSGQQPGLFGGPVYTWSKALSALALADAIEARTGRPAAPVFWAATDDADFAEASSTVVALEGGAQELRIARQSHEGLPMARTPLGPDVRDAFEMLERGAGSAAFTEILAAARDAYVPGETVGGAYLRLLRALLEPLGIAVLDASHPAIRSAGDALLRDALQRADVVDRALSDRVREIEEAGYTPQVPSVRGLSLVFLDDRDGRRRVRIGEGAAVAGRAPAAELGPNVLLRPLVEREILPTVAYVAGPGEIAYFAQVGAVAEALGRPVPLAVPRWSGTIVEPHVARILARLGLDAAELADPHRPETRLARSGLPPQVASSLAEFREAVRARSAALRAAQAGSAHPLLSPATIDGYERALLGRLDRLERRVTAAQKRAAVAQMHDVATVRGALFPFGKRQERVLNLLPTLARHGPPVLDAMRAAATRHADAIAGPPDPRAPGTSGERGGVATG